MKYKLRLFTLIFFIFWIHIVSFSQNTPGKLKGSVSQINITPPTGGRLAGHFYEILSTGIHDSLWAKAMVFQQGKEKFAFVFCDLIGLTEDISTAARTLASAKTGISAKNILIGATHSHNGPLFYGFQYAYFHHKALIDKKEDPHEKIDYSNFLIHQISKAIEKANESIAPIQIKVGVGEQHNLSFNRRYYMKNGPVLFNPGPLNTDIVGPAGPIDPEVGIFLINKVKSKKYEGGLIVFSMHADCIGGTEISADYPYFLEQTLKNKFGKNFISTFSVGASGDINDIDVKKDSPIYSASNTQRIGKELGKTVINKEPELKLISKPSLATVSAKIFLPLQVPSKKKIDSAKEMINNLYKASETGIYFKNAGGESGDFLKRVEMSKYISLENQKPSVQVEVQVFRIDNETAIVGLPGELFVELGIDIKRKSPFKYTMVLTVCNNRISYIPTQKAFTEGSYEVINSIVKPGSGEMLVETAIQLLNKVKSL